MTDRPAPKSGTPPQRLAAAATPRGEDFPAEFARIKLTIIRPAFEKVGGSLKARGHDIHISEDDHGSLSIHIVPPGVKMTVHGYDWYPTLSFIGAPFTKTIGLQGRNARRNSEGAPGSRGNYKPAQLSQPLVEKELLKFVGEIANWS
jgi:hypothetical protein